MKTLKSGPSSIPATATVLASDITGSRFTIDTIYPQLQDLLGFDADCHVTKSVATELKKLLNGQRTGILQKKDGQQAKLYLTSQPGGKTKLHQIDIIIDLTHVEGYMGHLFSAQDKAYLERYGNMGRRVSLHDDQTAESFVGYIGVDRSRQKLSVLRSDEITVHYRLKGRLLSEEQRNMLLEGKALRLDSMRGTSGTFSAYVRIHAGHRKFTFEKIPDFGRRQKGAKS